MSSAGTRSARYQEGNVLSHHAEAATPTAAEEASMTMPHEFETATVQTLLERILSSLAEDKAEDVVVIDLRGKSEMADSMVVCSGRSSRQVAAISEKLVERLKVDPGVNSKVEGKETGDWVLIDAGDVIVHVFRPEVRDFYQLEKMWLPAGSAKRTGSQA
ncbi:ribosome silencing factor [Tropicimonas sp. IMCC6043]|nr:ribosome silencing factor [Tropicimonas sp. IMCC6043]